jgi:hypothetical protein
MTDGPLPAPVPVILADTVEVVMFAERANQSRCNVIHYHYTGGAPTTAELSSLCDEIDTQLIEEYEDFISVGTVWTRILARDMASLSGAMFEKQITRLGAGGSQAAPSNVSLCLSKRSGRRGRSNHGRFYIFDCPEDMFNGDTLNPGYLPSIGDLARELLETRVAGRFTPAIASRKNGDSLPFNSVTWDQVADSQRRRLPLRGA